MDNNVIYANVKIIKNHMDEIEKESKLYLHLQKEVDDMIASLPTTVASILAIDVLLNRKYLN